MGSTRVPALAGSQLATRAAPASRITAPPRVSGSLGLTW